MKQVDRPRLPTTGRVVLTTVMSSGNTTWPRAYSLFSLSPHDRPGQQVDRRPAKKKDIERNLLFDCPPSSCGDSNAHHYESSR